MLYFICAWLLLINFDGVVLMNIRLVGSGQQCVGRLEVNYNGEWGSVCSDHFDDRDARVACAALGYGYVGKTLNTRFGAGSGRIWIDDLNCNGTEKTLMACGMRAIGSHDCTHNKDVSISCASSIQGVDLMYRMSFNNFSELTVMRTIAERHENGTDYCPQRIFRCGSGVHVPETFRCDGADDCGDKSDERDCECDTSTHFMCSNRQCVHAIYRCNAEYDGCRDGSDEVGCSSCTNGTFLCDGANRKCIKASKRCDKINDCADGSDENGCPHKQRFRCRDGSETSMDKRCNGLSGACPDLSDETNCTACIGSTFYCRNRKCIPDERRCDRSNDCGDNSDETNCTCGELRHYRCDRVIQCAEGDDELNCANIQPTQALQIPSACFGATTHRCRNGQCIPSSYLCDGDNDCGDGSDEIGCERVFACASGESIPEINLCDGTSHCSDSSDEVNCSKCSSNAVLCSDGACIQRNLRCNGVGDCNDAGDEKNCKCEMTEFTCGVAVITAAGDREFFRHRSRCIPYGSVCDGVGDCADGSDEFNCSAKSAFKCSNGIYVSGRSVCDGVNNCGDFSDEERCENFILRVSVGVTVLLVLLTSIIIIVLAVKVHRMKCTVPHKRQEPPIAMTTPCAHPSLYTNTRGQHVDDNLYDDVDGI